MLRTVFDRELLVTKHFQADLVLAGCIVPDILCRLARIHDFVHFHLLTLHCSMAAVFDYGVLMSFGWQNIEKPAAQLLPNVTLNKYFRIYLRCLANLLPHVKIHFKYIMSKF
jgi:hypothetical protein